MREKIHVTPFERNLFANLGFEAEEAEQLKAESNRRVRADLKIQLMEEVANTIRERHMKQDEAAKLLDVTCSLRPQG